MKANPRELAILSLAAALLLGSRAVALQPLEDFIRAAREQNPDAQRARANLAEATAAAEVALGKQLPGVAIRATYDRNQHDVSLSLPTEPPIALHIQPNDQWTGVGTLNVPLVDLAGFRRISAAKTNAESTSHALAATRLAVEGQTVQDYYQLLANFALVATAENYVKVSRDNLAVTETRRRAGAATGLEVDRARADVEQQVQQLAAAELQVALVARDLLSTSSLEPDLSSAAELTDDLHSEAELSAFESVLEGVPSVAAARSATMAAQQRAEAQDLALLPTLGARFTESVTSAPGFQPTHWFWQAGVTASWAFDLTYIANIRVERAAAEAARAQETRTRLDAGDAIHRYWETVASDIAQSRSARVGRDAAAHALDQAQVQYKAGAIQQLDLLQAQRDAFQADVTRIRTDANLLNARAQLRLSAGQTLLP